MVYKRDLRLGDLGVSSSVGIAKMGPLLRRLLLSGSRCVSVPFVFTAAVFWVAIMAGSCAAFEFHLERPLETYAEAEVQVMLGQFMTDFKAELDQNRTDNKYWLAEKNIPCDICQNSLQTLKTSQAQCESACVSAMHYGLLDFRGRRACEGVCELLGLFQLSYNPCYAVGVCPWVRDESLPNYRPVVLMHGVNSDHTALYNVSSWIQEYLPNIYVHNVELGDGQFHSIFTTLDKQVEEFASIVAGDPMLAQGFNLVGFSQGTLITRGYIEKFNNPPVYNYISFSGPQGGQYGIPYLNINFLDGVVNLLAYRWWAQAAIGITGYWRDPYKPEEYLTGASYLPDLNNIRPGSFNETYRKHILSLNTFVMSYSQIDDVIAPPRSGWFEFFAPNSHTDIVDLKNDTIYINDTFGLRTLDETGRLVYLIDECKHSAHESDACGRRWFINDQLSYLDNTLDGSSLANVRVGLHAHNGTRVGGGSAPFGSTAIAGIVVGCAGVLAATGAVVMLALRRRLQASVEEKEGLPLLRTDAPIACPPEYDAIHESA